MASLTLASLAAQNTLNARAYIVQALLSIGKGTSEAALPYSRLMPTETTARDGQLNTDSARS